MFLFPSEGGAYPPDASEGRSQLKLGPWDKTSDINVSTKGLSGCKMDGSSEQRSKICENPDISKAPADISFEMKVALGRKNDYYLTGYRQPWIRGASSGTEIIRGT